MDRKFLSIVLLALFYCGQALAQEQKIIRDSLRITLDSLKIQRNLFRITRDSSGTSHDSLMITMDSLKIIRDSLNIVQDSITYKAIDRYSQKSKFTRFLHHLFFKSVVTETATKAKTGKIKKTKLYRKPEISILLRLILLDIIFRTLPGIRGGF
jgi:hypothetical protein